MKTAINIPGAPKPVAPYSQAIADEGFVFVSGQGPIDPVTNLYQAGDIRTETERTLKNLQIILEAAGSSMKKVTKVNVYLRDIRDFPGMNEVYARFFVPPYPARTTIQAGALPNGIAVEIDCTARQ
jgi:2-iminobutanoate/2-iminopropanoate deaminase